MSGFNPPLPHLALFMTRNMSVAAWDKGGMLARETAIYRTLLPRLDGITIVSYGGPEEREYETRLDGIRVVANTARLSERRFFAGLAAAAPWLRGPGLVVKSNQILGADRALTFARAVRAPFIARCGYLLGDFARRHRVGGPVKALLRRIHADRLERKVFTGADLGVVATDAMRRQVIEHYGLAAERVRVVPNYVDTDLFAPCPGVQARPGRVVFVGRLEEQKNLPTLLGACAGLDGVELVLAGDGRLRPALEQQAAALGVNARFLGRVANETLPDLIASAAVFVLPSFYEGHPKTLLEAMAAGAAVLGSDVSGIRECISHGQTGWLCAPETDALRQALTTLLGDCGLRTRLGAAARLHAIDTLSLSRVADMELDNYRYVLSGGGRLVRG